MTVIFDLDGTLADSVEDLGDSVNKALSEYDLPLHTYDEYRDFVGNGTKLLVSRAVPPDVRDTELEKAVFDRFSDIYEINCLNKTRPYDGITEQLLKLKQSGARLAVASNKPHEFSEGIVFHLFGNELFDGVFGSRDGIPKKPRPDIIEHILSVLSSDKRDCVLIGDSEVDVQTAENAGIACIGCTWGFRGRDRLESTGCDKLIDSPHEIYGAVEELQNR